MLVDLHAHYPMHLVPGARARTHERLRAWRRERWRARVVALISRLANYQGPGDEPAVTEPLMRAGDVGVALSVLYQPFDEIDLHEPYGARPRPGYFADLLDQLALVEDDVAGREGISVAHGPDELDAALAAGEIALIHAVEGGFHLGDHPDEVAERVATLADLGVAYVTLAHLFWRRVATNAPALPFLPDRLYHLLFRQPRDQGLSDLGRAAVEAMIQHRVLVDITHMSPASIADTLALFDERDPARTVPLIASHMACRLGSLEYCLDDETIRRVAERGGLLACILCEHYVADGQRGRPDDFESSCRALFGHVDRIRELTGSHEHAAIGSDLDGYIKPALPGLEHMGCMGPLQAALRDRYGPAVGDRIASGNALRVLREGWRRPGP